MKLWQLLVAAVILGGIVVGAIACNKDAVCAKLDSFKTWVEKARPVLSGVQQAQHGLNAFDEAWKTKTALCSADKIDVAGVLGAIIQGAGAIPELVQLYAQFAPQPKAMDKAELEAYAADMRDAQHVGAEAKSLAEWAEGQQAKQTKKLSK